MPVCVSLRRRHSRSRSAVLWGLAAFAVVQLATAVVLERWRPDLRDPEYGARLAGLRKRLAAEPDRPLVLLLGSSRTEVGLRPGDVLPGAAEGGAPLVFNFGLSGAGPVQELLCLRRLLAEGVRPAWVLVEVLPPLLNCSGTPDGPVRVERLAWGDLGPAGRYCARPGDLYRRWCQHNAVPWSAHRFCFLSRYLPAWLPWYSRQDHLWNGSDADGWTPHVHKNDDAAFRRRVERDREEYAPYFHEFRVGAPADRALRDLLDLCRREGIRTALYVMPESGEFRGWYPPAARAAIDAYLAALAREYGAPLFDARAWADDRDFFDGHHLSAEGAAAFSARFGREVVRPLLAAGEPRPAGGPR